jgi:hypothetical protein
MEVKIISLIFLDIELLIHCDNDQDHVKNKSSLKIYLKFTVYCKMNKKFIHKRETMPICF